MTKMWMILVFVFVQAAAQPDALVIQGGTLFDGTGAVMRDAVVVIRGSRISAVGRTDQVAIPAGVRRVDARGKFLLPGLIDGHFHFNEKSDADISPWLPLHFLASGVTTLREMGNWIAEENEDWLKRVKTRGLTAPRLLFSGPVIDGANPVNPAVSIVVLDELEARLAARRLMDQGATSLKVYARLPLSLVKAVIEEARTRGVPVHAHLGAVDPRDAIDVGLDGIEHATSLVRALLPPFESEAYRQLALREPNPRPIEAWANFDPEGPLATALIDKIVKHRVNFGSTLVTHEPNDSTTEERRRSHKNMAAFTVRLHRAGASVTMGSHGRPRGAPPGLGLHREMELLVRAGMAPPDALQAVTRVAARALRLDDRGLIAPGKLADLVLLDADPLADIQNARKVHTVILDGRIIDREALLAQRQKP